MNNTAKTFLIRLKPLWWITIRCLDLLLALSRRVDYVAHRRGNLRRILLYTSQGACQPHVKDFAEIISSLSEYVEFDTCFVSVDNIKSSICSIFRSHTRHYDLIVTAANYPDSFRGSSSKLIYTNHGAHIIGIDGGANTYTYTNFTKSHPDIMLEPNRYKAEAVVRDHPELKDVVRWVGWKFAEKERDAVRDRRAIRERLGFGDSDTVVFVAATWGPCSLFHTYGDRIFDVLKVLAKEYRIIVSDHINDYVTQPKIYGDKVAATKGPQVDKLAESGCIVRKFDEPWIEYMAAADVVFTDYSTLSEEAVAMGKKVIFSNYPDEVVWRHSVCYRARKFLPVVEDIERLGEYIEQARAMEIPEAVREMADETYVSRKDYEESVLRITKDLLGLK